MKLKELRSVWSGDAAIRINGDTETVVMKPFDFVEKYGAEYDDAIVWSVKSGLRTDGLAIIELAL